MTTTQIYVAAKMESLVRSSIDGSTAHLHDLSWKRSFYTTIFKYYYKEKKTRTLEMV